MTRVLFILIAAVSIGVAAQLSIELSESISPLPITAQTLAILMIIELFRWKDAAISVALYLLFGALGLPIFSNFEGGFDKLIGPSFGYFIGFMISAIAVSYWSNNGKKGFIQYFLRMTIATLIILFFGYLGLLRYLDPSEAMWKGVLPFLPGGLIKILVGASLIALISKFKSIMSNPDLKH